MNFNTYKKNCVICQTSDLSLFAAKSENAALIALKNNFLAGDAVLRLKNSSCKNIILFGGCGGCANANIGDMLIIDKAYNFESFTDMIEKGGNPLNCVGNYETKAFERDNVIKTNAACVSSLILERNYVDFFKDNAIGAVDMESSIVLSAAKAIGAKAFCFFYVSDRVERPFEPVLTNDEKAKIGNARKKLSEIVLRLCDEL